jgi:hypothetical protein
MGSLQNEGYEFDPQEEYLFYPEALSRQNSYNKLFVPSQKTQETKNALYDPNIRKNVKSLKRPRPWFLMIMSAAQLAVYIYSLVLNYQINGKPFHLDFNDFGNAAKNNYLIGPPTGVLFASDRRS